MYNIIIEKGCDFLVGTYSAAREQQISILLYGFTYYYRTRNGITFTGSLFTRINIHILVAAIEILISGGIVSHVSFNHDECFEYRTYYYYYYYV